MAALSKLELSVIQSIVSINRGQNIKLVTKTIVNQNSVIKQKQLNAIVLNLVNKKVVVKPSTSEIQLTPEAFKLYVPNQVVYNTVTVNGNKVHSVEELIFINKLISLRSQTLKILHKLNKAFS